MIVDIKLNGKVYRDVEVTNIRDDQIKEFMDRFNDKYSSSHDISEEDGQDTHGKTPTLQA